MIIFLSGEPYQAHAFLDDVRMQKRKEGAEYYYIEGNDDAKDAKAKLGEALSGQSLFAKTKLIVVRVDTAATIKDILLDVTKRESIEPYALVLFAPGVKEATFKDNKITLKHFSMPRGAALKGFIEKEFQKRGIAKEHPMVALLCQSIPYALETLMPLINEIEKMSLAGERFRDVFTLQEASAPFALLDAFTKREKAKVWLLLERQLQEGEKPFDILGRIIWQLRVLLLVSDYKLNTTSFKLSLHPFVIKKAQDALRFFSKDEVGKLFLEAISVYEKMLFSSLPSELLLSLFLAKL